MWKVIQRLLHGAGVNKGGISHHYPLPRDHLCLSIPTSKSSPVRYCHSSAALRNKENVLEKRDDDCEKSKKSDGNDDDLQFFKRLSKTMNPHWISNADSVLSRLELSRYLDPSKRNDLEALFHRRIAEVDLDRISKLWDERIRSANDLSKQQALTEELVSLALWIPNDTHPESIAIEGEIPKEIFRSGVPRTDDVIEFSKFCNKYGLLRDDQLGNLAFHRSYYLKGPLAELEEGLIRYSLASLESKNFQLISVPDMLYPHLIESCGMKTRSDRDQVFWLQSSASDEALCLSGTAEMSIGGSLQDKVFDEEDLPIRLTSVSRCFRAETSTVEEERGLFRVHEFTKVEMFGVTANETGRESNDLHEEFRQIEEDNFRALNIHFKTLEMPPYELGTSAFRKFDIEAWMPGRKMFGEISSCSNCTDFQSRRLNVRYRPRGSKSDENLKFVHTVNGTACAIPRLLITLVENFQNPNGILDLPAVLQPFMPRDWREALTNSPVPKSIFLRTKSQQDKYIHNSRPQF